jgi:exodeoxyribonuclease-3
VNTAHKEIDLARPKENVKVSGFLPKERAWMDEFLARGYKDTLRIFNQEPGNYSYWDQMTRARDRNVGWRIDYFFADDDFAERLTGAFILSDVYGSDHCPVGIEIG